MYMYVYNTICGFDSLFIVLPISLLFFVFVFFLGGGGVGGAFCPCFVMQYLISF